MNLAYDQLITVLAVMFVLFVVIISITVFAAIYLIISIFTIKCDHCKKRKLKQRSDEDGVVIGYICRDCIGTIDHLKGGISNEN